MNLRLAPVLAISSRRLRQRDNQVDGRRRPSVSLVRLMHRQESMLAPWKPLMLAATVHATVTAAPVTIFAQTRDEPPAPAATNPSGSDTIPTKNGGEPHGTTIEVTPDVQVRIQPADPPKPSAPSEVWVHLEAPEGVVLQQDKTGMQDWETVCSAPCDQPLPTAFYYRAVGGGIKTSDDFALKGSPGDRDTVVVDGASRTASVLGALVLGAGGIADFVGLAVTVASTVDGEGWTVAGPGLAALGLGTVAVVGGYVVAQKATRVDQKLGAGPTGQALSGPGTRGPTGNGALTAPKSMPPVVSVPIFIGRF